MAIEIDHLHNQKEIKRTVPAGSKQGLVCVLATGVRSSKRKKERNPLTPHFR
jgi:hypothetical protein